VCNSILGCVLSNTTCLVYICTHICLVYTAVDVISEGTCFIFHVRVYVDNINFLMKNKVRPLTFGFTTYHVQ